MDNDRNTDSLKLDTSVPTECLMCNKIVTVVVNRDDYDRWRAKEGLIQDILWYLDDGEREILVSKICSDCFENLFTNDERGEQS